jgi:hypothetical protein
MTRPRKPLKGRKPRLFLDPCTIDLSGKRFVHLTVTRRVGTTIYGAWTWEARCDCGNLIVEAGSRLRDRSVISCGCVEKRPRPRVEDRSAEVVRRRQAGQTVSIISRDTGLSREQVWRLLVRDRR